MSSQTCAVIVTFQPALDVFLRLLAAVKPQVDKCVVVDNGSARELSIRLVASRSDKVEVVVLAENVGIGAAQNLGIQQAKKAGAEYVLLFDQDSEPQSTMVESLVGAIQRLRQDGERVAAVGANYLSSSQTPFRRVHGPLIRSCRCLAESALIEVDYLIASGCLIPIEVLDHVGPMNESLFIDYVDTEWSLRARSMGYSLHGVCGARMAHRLGDTAVHIGGRVITMRSPLRHYYMFRNGVWLYLHGNVSRLWKLADGINLLMKFFMYLLLAQSRWAHFRFMMLGIWHGVIGRLGKLS